MPIFGALSDWEASVGLGAHRPSSETASRHTVDVVSQRPERQLPRMKRRRGWGTPLSACGLGIIAALAVHAVPRVSTSPSAARVAWSSDDEWPSYGHDFTNQRFSPLT